MKKDSILFEEIKKFEAALQIKGYFHNKCNIDINLNTIDFDKEINKAGMPGGPEQIDFLKHLKIATEETKQKCTNDIKHRNS